MKDEQGTRETGSEGGRRGRGEGPRGRRRGPGVACAAAADDLYARLQAAGVTFKYPAVGAALPTSIQPSRDSHAGRLAIVDARNEVQGVVMVFTFVFTLANLVADIANAWLNPRIAAASA